MRGHRDGANFEPARKGTPARGKRDIKAATPPPHTHTHTHTAVQGTVERS